MDVPALPCMKYRIGRTLVVLIGVLLLVAVGVTACHRKSWREEVVLHDGRAMVVQRSQKLDGYPTIASRERSVIEEKWVFPFAGKAEPVVWTTGFCMPPKCGSLMLLRVDLVGGVPYIATRPAGCIAYNYWGRPNPPYVFFKYDDGKWRRIKIGEFPKELDTPNVVVGRPDPKHRSGLLSESVIKEENRPLESYDGHISRQPIKGGNISCGKMIYDGHGGWVGLGWFRDQPSIKACNGYCQRNKINTAHCPCDSLFKGEK